jgi:hypothetical protein
VWLRCQEPNATCVCVDSFVDARWVVGRFQHVAVRTSLRLLAEHNVLETVNHDAGLYRVRARSLSVHVYLCVCCDMCERLGTVDLLPAPARDLLDRALHAHLTTMARAGQRIPRFWGRRKAITQGMAPHGWNPAALADLAGDALRDGSAQDHWESALNSTLY